MTEITHFTYLNYFRLSFPPGCGGEAHAGPLLTSHWLLYLGWIDRFIHEVKVPPSPRVYYCSVLLILPHWRTCLYWFGMWLLHMCPSKRTVSARSSFSPPCLFGWYNGLTFDDFGRVRLAFLVQTRILKWMDHSDSAYECVML